MGKRSDPILHQRKYTDSKEVPWMLNIISY